MESAPGAFVKNTQVFDIFRVDAIYNTETLPFVVFSAVAQSDYHSITTHITVGILLVRSAEHYVFAISARPRSHPLADSNAPEVYVGPVRTSEALEMRPEALETIFEIRSEVLGIGLEAVDTRFEVLPIRFEALDIIFEYLDLVPHGTQFRR